MQLAAVTREAGKTERQCLPVALIADEHITEACQAISKLPQGLVGHKHDGPYTAVLEVCHLQCHNICHQLLVRVQMILMVSLVSLMPQDASSYT